MYIRFGLAQLNPITGDFDGNEKLMTDYLTIAKENNIDVLVYPKFSFSGYGSDGLMLREDYLNKEFQTVDHFGRVVADSFSGSIFTTSFDNDNNSVYSSLKLVESRPQIPVTHDMGLDSELFVTTTENDKRVGYAIFSGDSWMKPELVDKALSKVSQFAIVLDAKPYHTESFNETVELLKEHICSKGLKVVYCNLLGGHDECVFDGTSFVMGEDGEVRALGTRFKQGLNVFEISIFDDEVTHHEFIEYSSNSLNSETLYELDCLEAEIWSALCLATNNYIRKNNFSQIVLGLSGGIDSALVLAIASDAIGAQNCHALSMPSEFTAQMSNDDAKTMCSTLKVKYDIVPIRPMYQVIHDSLKPLLEQIETQSKDVTLENLQARVRGVILMALANKKNALVLSTGNKSESATGYCTLYGDMVGAFSVISDVPKTLVYRLAMWRNSQSSTIPQRIIERAPSAELAPGQVDQDSLPPYDVLDQIIDGLLLNDKSSSELKITTSLSPEEIDKTSKLLKISEFKRRQAALGPKISKRSFFSGWNVPVTHKYKF